MESFDGDQVAARLPWGDLERALAAALIDDAYRNSSAPPRTVIPMATGAEEQTMLIMPAWEPGVISGVKIVHHTPGNTHRGLSTIQATYVAFDGVTGRPAAILDGDALTVRRTAAVSALAARWLARPSARRLLIMGTGQLAPALAAAHLAINGLDHVMVWGRNEQRTADAVAATQLQVRDAHARERVASPVIVEAAGDLAHAIAAADVIVTATGATHPILHGDTVRPGTHVSLIGSYQPTMREADTELFRRAMVAVDTRGGALLSGDLAQPIAAGEFDESIVQCDLADLVNGRHPGRTADDQITVFKSAGFSLADLAAARCVIQAPPRSGERGDLHHDV